MFGGERLSRYEYVSILFAMLGVVILTYPSAVFWWLDDARGFDINDYPFFGLGVFIALLGSIGSGFAYLMMRKIGRQIDSSSTTMWFGCFCIFCGIFMILIFQQPLVEGLDLYAVGLLTLVGIFGWTA